MIRFFNRLLKNVSGATAVEYGLIAALVSVAAVGALSSMGVSLQGLFGKVTTEVQNSTSGGATP